MWVVMVQHKTSNQYLTSGKVSLSSIHRFKRYRLVKTLTKNFNILSNADVDADANADADADAVVTAIALPVLSYRRAKKRFLQKVHQWIWAFCSNIDLFGGHLHFLRGMNMQFSVITTCMHFFTF